MHPADAHLHPPDGRHRLRHQRPQPGDGGPDRADAARAELRRRPPGQEQPASASTSTRTASRSAGRSTSAPRPCGTSASGWASKMDGFEMDSGFQITVSSEVMAILAVARDLKDLRRADRPDGRGLQPKRQGGHDGRPGGGRRDDGLDARRHQSQPAADHRGPARVRPRRAVRQYRHRAKLDHRRPARHEAGRLPRHRERLRRGHRLREVLEPQVPHVGPEARRGRDRGDDPRPQDARRRSGRQAGRAARRGLHQREPRAGGEGLREPPRPHRDRPKERRAAGRLHQQLPHRHATPRSPSCGGSPRPTAPGPSRPSTGSRAARARSSWPRR